MQEFHIPRGVKDIYGEDYRILQKVIEYIRSNIEQYGYNGIQLSTMENQNLFMNSSGEDSDIAKEIYYITHKYDQDHKLVLRPEGTASTIRSIITNKLSTKYQKLFYYGSMFRHDRPQKNRFREFNQFGIEFIGTDSYLSDLEVIMIANNILKDCKLYINTIGTYEERKKYLEDLKIYFIKRKADLKCKKNIERIETNPLRILDSKTDQEVICNAPCIMNSLSKETIEKFQKLCTTLSKLNIEFEHDPLLVRGLDYYCHTVFEFKSTIDHAAQNTILAGGRYNNILNTNINGVGWALGLERYINVMRNHFQYTQPKVLAISIENHFMINIMQDLIDRKLNMKIITMYNGLSGDLRAANHTNANFILFSDDKDNLILKDLLSGNQTLYSSINDLIMMLGDLSL